MSDEVKDDDDINSLDRIQLLPFLITLRDVGKETKYHIYDVLDPGHERERKKQFVAIALVSSDEILNENFSVFKDFTDYLHTISDCKTVASRIVHHGRIAVALNTGPKNFYEHGECRLLDPYKKILFKIISEETETRTGKCKTGKNKVIIPENCERKILKEIMKSYKKLYHVLDDAVLLLFSYFIPCSIDFHQCSRLIREFVTASGLRMAIGYESFYAFTDEVESSNWLDVPNIRLIHSDEFWVGVRNQVAPLISRDIFGIKYDFIDEKDDDNFEEDFRDFSDDVWDCINYEQTRKFRKTLCRKILKTYNNFLT